LDLLKPEYNNLLKAGSPLGSKHSEQAKAKMSQAKKETKTREGVKVVHEQKEQEVLMFR
jgi:ABC-type Fe3+ transport system substrate-binding protein